MLEPLAIGKWTLKAEVSDDTSTRRRSGRTGVSAPRGTSAAIASAPAEVTMTMYQRAAGGSSRNIDRDQGLARIPSASVRDPEAELNLPRLIEEVRRGRRLQICVAEVVRRIPGRVLDVERVEHVDDALQRDVLHLD